MSSWDCFAGLSQTQDDMGQQLLLKGRISRTVSVTGGEWEKLQDSELSRP